MEIVSKISEKDYVNVFFTILWAKRSIRFCTIIFILIFVLGSFNVFVLKTTGPVTLLFPLLFLIVFSVSIYFGAKRTFKTDGRISETIRYVFDDVKLAIQGESFESILNWDKVYKVTRSKHWLLIWQNNVLANAISMASLDEQEIDYLRGILNANKVQHSI